MNNQSLIKKNLKIVLLLAMLFVAGAASQVVLAQGAATPIEVAQPNIQNLSIASDTYSAGATVSGKFEIFNSSSIDFSDLYYRILLVGKYDAHGMAQAIYDQTDPRGPYFVKSNGTQAVSFSYILPKSVPENKIGLQVQIVSKSGQLYAWSDAHFSLFGTSNSITVNTLSLKIGTTYIKPDAGPTVYNGKSISLVVQVTNPLKNDLSLTPRIKVYNRVIAGAPLFSSTTPALTLAYNKKTTYSFDLPTFGYTAGVYAGTIDFVDAKGVAHSPLSEFRYIVGGDIATIQSVTITPESVSKGQSVAVAVLYSGMPYDILTFKRANAGLGDLSVTLYDQKGTPVGSASSTVDLSVDAATKTVNIAATADAAALKASVTISKDGKILAQFSTNPNPALTNPNNSGGSTSSPAGSSDWLGPLLTGLGTLILLTVVIVLILLKKKRTSNSAPAGQILPVIIFFFFIAAGCLLLPATTKATTWYETASGGTAPDDFLSNDDITPNITPTTNLQVGQAFQLSLSVTAMACTNANDTVSVEVPYPTGDTSDIYPTGGSPQVFTQGNGRVSCSGNCFSAADTGWIGADKVNILNQIYAGSYTAPNTPGTYYVHFKVHNTWVGSWGIMTNWREGYIVINVSANPVGYLDSANCTTNLIKGWTCDADNYATPLSVDLYKDTPKGVDGVAGSNYIGRYSAGDYRSGLANVCGGNPNHAYNITMPDSLKGTAHSLYVYGINIGGGKDTKLTNSGDSSTSINCLSPVGTPTTPAVTCTPDNSSVVVGGTVSYTAHPVGGDGTYTSYTWSGVSAPDTFMANGATATSTYNSTGSKSVTLTVTSNGVTSVSSPNCAATVTASNAPLTTTCSIAHRSNLDISNGLVGYWNMDGNVNDTSGSGNNDSAVGSPTYSVGELGQAISLNGAGQYVLGSTFNNAPASQMTTCAWIKTASAATDQYIWSINRSPSNYLNEGSLELSSGKPQFWDFGLGVYGFDSSQTAVHAVNDGSWHNICFVKNGTNGTYYKDGSADGTAVAANDVSYGSSASAIGANYRDNNGYFNGSIDDVRIYNRSLSATEVAAVYNSGVASDPSNPAVGDQVTYTANPAGGSGNYTYAWSDSDSLLNSSAQWANITYTTTGSKWAKVIVTDTSNGSQTPPGTCNTTVTSSVSPGTPVLDFYGTVGNSSTHLTNLSVNVGDTYTLHATLGNLVAMAEPTWWQKALSFLGLDQKIALADFGEAASGNYSCLGTGAWNQDTTLAYGSSGSKTFTANAPGDLTYYFTCTSITPGTWSGTIPTGTVVVHINGTAPPVVASQCCALKPGSTSCTTSALQSARVGDIIIWHTDTTGTGYVYSWSGTDLPVTDTSSGQDLHMTYSSPGQKFMSLLVTDSTTGLVFSQGFCTAATSIPGQPLLVSIMPIQNPF